MRRTVLTDLQARGVQDILIVCVDGLKGFPDAIASVYPETTVQLCIFHQIRNSVKYVASRNQKEFMKDLKLVYLAFTRIRKKWTQPVQNWGQTAQQLAILFPDRFKLIG